MICFVVLFGSNVVGLLGSVVVEEFVFCDDGSLLWMTAGKRTKSCTNIIILTDVKTERRIQFVVSSSVIPQNSSLSSL